jgi:hypothetical protein
LFNFSLKPWNTWTAATPPAIEPIKATPDFRSSRARVSKVSDVFDDLVDRQASPDVGSRIAAIVASDFRFAYFGTGAFAVRLLRLDQKLMDGISMNPRRMANLLNVTPELLREFLAHLSKPDDETATLYADGGAG